MLTYSFLHVQKILVIMTMQTRSSTFLRVFLLLLYENIINTHDIPVIKPSKKHIVPEGTGGTWGLEVKGWSLAQVSCLAKSFSCSTAPVALQPWWDVPARCLKPGCFTYIYCWSLKRNHHIVEFYSSPEMNSLLKNRKYVLHQLNIQGED